jgi:hypothetical protein
VVENLFCAGTFQNILPRIANPALESADIKLSNKVTRVEATKDGGLRVLTSEGDEFEYDEVVMTTPLGWLKRNTAAFVPPLPTRLLEAIDGIGYGCLEKVFITFPRAFWLDKNTATADQPFTGFTQWLSPAYAADTNPQRWYQECVDLSTLPAGCAHPTLLFYIFGDQSQKLANLLSKKSKAEATNLLIDFFKPYYSLLPHFEEGSRECVPTSCVATTWCHDELAGYGSYSTFRTGLTEGDKVISPKTPRSTRVKEERSDFKSTHQLNTLETSPSLVTLIYRKYLLC